MITASHFHSTDSRPLALPDPFPAGCDPDFDADMDELEYQFAELRLTLDHN